MQTFYLQLPPFVFAIHTDIRLVIKNSELIYGSAFLEKLSKIEFVDYHITICFSGGIRKFYKPQARFLSDEREPFKPLKANQAYAMMEWGMNWTVAAYELQHVIIHAAVLEKNGKAILFPAPPGSGKSTLTAHLANSGWRLLSDEMALIEPGSHTVIPFVRPICLKNSSIGLAKSWFPDCNYSTIAKDTHKGNVIHMAPSSAALNEAKTPAKIVGVVFPQFDKSIELDIYQLNMTDAFMKLVENAFNFTAVDKGSFSTVTQLIEKTHNFEIQYNDLQQVQSFLEEDIIDAS